MRTLATSSITLTLAIMGCASPPGGGTLSYSLSRPVLSGGPEVAIDVDATSLPPGKREVFLEQGGARRIADGVARELNAAPGKRWDVPHTIHISVTGFRLRSTGNGLWVGVAAGPDLLEVHVEVEAEGKTVRSYSTQAATVLAGIVRPSATGRFTRLVNAVSERVVQGL